MTPLLCLDINSVNILPNFDSIFNPSLISKRNPSYQEELPFENCGVLRRRDDFNPGSCFLKEENDLAVCFSNDSDF